MQINTVGPNFTIKSTKVEKKSAKSKTEFQDSLEDTQETHPVHASTFIYGVDPLFTDLENPSRKKEAIKAGIKILDDLDRLRILMLHSDTAQDAIKILNNIQQSVSQYTTIDLDPELRDILTEIETRAVVELAKAKYL